MCHLVELSGRQMGFHNMDMVEANEAAKELGAINYYEYRVSYAPPYSTTRSTLMSVSYFDKNNEEIFYWSSQMQAGAIHDPPRQWGKLPCPLQILRK